MKKTIYIAYTGGTIGMQVSKNGYIPVPGFLEETLANMPEFHRSEMPNYVLHEYENLIDSSNMSPSDWNLIAEDIRSQYHKYDAFIILHGTDTMAYTASALSFMFENLQKPVIVTGSQIPLAELRSDGQENLLNALYVAANYPIAEVTLYFSNKLFRGNRSRKIDANGFDAFGSPNFPALLEAGINISLLAGELVTQSSTEPLIVTPINTQPIGVVTLYPGIATEVIENTLKQPVKALILLTYGVGNAPQNPKLLAQFERATQEGILVVNCTQCYKGKVSMEDYATGHTLFDAGLISGFDMTPEAALAKLHYVLGQPINHSQRKTLMAKNLRGELSC
ncbi:asparaginase [Alteromonas sp. 5E99-2]|uniref:asparaginase n=1 Tax=Alteromonas sp. 5E99-2 TaxID=2817683 RepID=UPI001A99623F|nr:asparaginase [Alteromonas sp. 5E99-2]MBO1255397.1 asparaginase [Alteromonas sp. 5E99-2]